MRIARKQPAMVPHQLQGLQKVRDMESHGVGLKKKLSERVVSNRPFLVRLITGYTCGALCVRKTSVGSINSAVAELGLRKGCQTEWFP